jgi:hypothetical protein
MKATVRAGKTRPQASVTHVSGDAGRVAGMRRVSKGIKERNQIA